GRRGNDRGNPFCAEPRAHDGKFSQTGSERRFLPHFNYSQTETNMKKLWISFSLVMGVSFSILGWIGTRIYEEKPPIPNRVVTTAGDIIIADGAVERGQNVWQSMGGMEVG